MACCGLVCGSPCGSPMWWQISPWPARKVTDFGCFEHCHNCAQASEVASCQGKIKPENSPESWAKSLSHKVFVIPSLECSWPFLFQASSILPILHGTLSTRDTSVCSKRAKGRRKATECQHGRCQCHQT